jgi:carboxyl-terminal processing protease
MMKSLPEIDGHIEKKPSRNKRVLWIIFPLVVLLFSASPLRENYFEMSKQLEIMTALFRELNIYYVDELQPGKLMESGINSMVESLDPYTIYYPESRVEDLRFMTTGEYGGIGASIQLMDGQHTFIDILPGFPAEKSGLKIGDVLLTVEEAVLRDIDESLVPEMLQGASGTEVRITYQRYGSSSADELVLTREKIKLPAVPFRSAIRDSTGYIILAAFTRGSSFEVREALRFLQDSVGINQLVLDLRGNGGGLLQESISIVNLFVEKGQEVVSTRGKNEEWMKSYTTRGEPIAPDLPLAVLIDSQSASASEIVAGTLQDLDRAIVIGQESFGKGLVQQTKQLAYGTRLKVTVAKYYTASGRCIQRLDYAGERSQDGSALAVSDSSIQVFYTRNGRPVVDGKGIQPDVEVEMPTLSYVLKGLQGNGVIFDFATQWVSKHDSIEDPNEFLVSDDIWDAFVEFTEQEDETVYESRSNAIWEALLNTAKTEHYIDGNENAFASFSDVIAPDIKRDLNQFRAEVAKSVQEEVLLRFYAQDDAIQWMIPQDSVLQKSVDLLSSGEATRLLMAPSNP